MCSSSDAYALYSDGHGFCFSCQGYVQNIVTSGYTPKKRNIMEGLIADSYYTSLSKRSINEDTCRKFGYTLADYKEAKWQVAPYYRDGQLIAQHLRSSSKDFKWLGESKEVELFGQHLWGQGGKMVVVTEGEIDCMSVSQIQNNKWPVVSIPSGVGSAKKSIQRNLEWLESFDTVVLMFDMDDAGRKATEDVVDLFSPGKCKVASLPLKDANECLLKGKSSDVIQAIWNAKTYRPDGVISGKDTFEMVFTEEDVVSSSYPWENINTFLSGIRQGELITVTAGSGIGKSLFCREVAHHLLKAGEVVGYVALEESVKRTVLGFMSIEANKPLHVSKEGVDNDSLKLAWDNTAGSGNLYLYDHWGSCDSDNLISRIRYLARGCGCKWVVLDHISIVVSGIGEGDERRLIDNTMTKLRSLVEETGIGLLLVSHLKRPEGNKGHEDGAVTSLSHLRGSASIAQLSDIVLGLERNQQGDDANMTTVRVLKNRYTGMTGIAGNLKYCKESGRMLEAEVAEVFSSEF
jgi:twinkle protein